MSSMFFSLIKEDCQEMSSSQKENGLLEIMMPKDFDDNEVLKYIKSLDKVEKNEIVDKQKKAKEEFRKKIKEMIDKHRKEFNLPFVIRLRIQTKTRKLNDCNLELHGVVFDGNLSIAADLQYFSDDLVEKIIRYTVLLLAREYEKKWAEINGVTTSTIDFSDGKITSSEFYDIEEDAKYRISLDYSEIQKIQADYKSAVQQIFDSMKIQPIMNV